MLTRGLPVMHRPPVDDDVDDRHGESNGDERQGDHEAVCESGRKTLMGAQSREEHGTNCSDTDRRPDPLAGLQQSARAARLCDRHLRHGQRLVRGDHQPTAQAGDEQRNQDRPAGAMVRRQADRDIDTDESQRHHGQPDHDQRPAVAIDDPATEDGSHAGSDGGGSRMK